MSYQNTMRAACAVSLCASTLALAAGTSTIAVDTPVDMEGQLLATNAFASAMDRVEVAPRFHVDAFMADDIALPAMHPPIETIPPMPMPNPDFEPQLRGGGPGNALFHDGMTGETIEMPVFSAGQESGAVANGFAGIESLEEFEDMFYTRGFGTMSLIPDASRANSPWRQNVKLVMEWRDSGTGALSYSVCSGAMADAEVVLTAGHCVYNRDNDSTGNDFGFANRVWVYPGWDGDGIATGVPGVLNHYGWAQSETFGAFTGWTVDGNFDWDIGLIRIDRAVGMLTGWHSYAWGGSCTGRNYDVMSYPAEFCGGSLHNGRDMYQWFGTFDSCPGNQMHIDTTPGCLTALWGGQSGSNVYYRSDDGNTRFVHGVASNSNRTTSGNYAKIWESFKDYMVDDFEPAARTNNFDLQALQVRVSPTTITAGNATTTATAQVPNPTNANPGSATYGFNMYLSTNNNISSGDVLLADRQYTFDYAAMQNVNLNTGNVTIPRNTPSGTYWVGIELDSGIDASNANNDSDLWDAQQITVNGVADIVANSCNAPNGTAYHGDSISVSYNVENEGGDPSNSVTLTFYASTNTDISAADTLLGSVNIGTFGGSQVKSGSHSVNIPSSLLGNYYIGYIASASDDVVVNQSNEAYDATPLAIDGRADLFANYLTALDSQAAVGGSTDVRFNVRNNGTISSGTYFVDVYASTNTTISVADTLLGTLARPSLPVGSSSTLVPSVNIPAFMSPGNYYLGMIVRGGANENATGDNSAFDSGAVTFTDCPVDFNNNGVYDLADINAFVSAFTSQAPIADIDENGVWDLTDIVKFVDLFTGGCP